MTVWMPAGDPWGSPLPMVEQDNLNVMHASRKWWRQDMLRCRITDPGGHWRGDESQDIVLVLARDGETYVVLVCVGYHNIIALPVDSAEAGLDMLARSVHAQSMYRWMFPLGEASE